MKSVIVIDTETTGLDARTERVVELAAVLLEEDPHTGWHPSDTFSSLVCPGIPIPPTASAVHHLVDEDVAGAPALASAWASMIRKFGEREFLGAAHNVKFDAAFLADVLPRGARMICTWRCCLHLFPDAPGHGNQTMRYFLGLKPDAPVGLHPHRALYDAIVTSGILGTLLKLKTPEELLDLSQRPVLMGRLPFGKHAGRPCAEIPRDYFQWILRVGNFDEDVMHTARHYGG